MKIGSTVMTLAVICMLNEPVLEFNVASPTTRVYMSLLVVMINALMKLFH